jgi:phage/plasmid-like protein (TIGR03299 family)
MKKTTEERVFDILEATQTNGSVKKLPLVSAVDGLPTDSYGLFRNDNNKWLGTVKDRYEPMQNSKLLHMLVEATDMLNLDVSKGGLLSNGAKVFYQMELTDEYIGNSGVKRYITASNSHDGSTSIGFGTTNTVIICQNTFHRAHRELAKVKHTMNSGLRVKALADDLRLTLGFEQKLMEDFKRMADVPMNDEVVERLIKKLFPPVSETDKLSDLSTKTKNKLVLFADNLQTEINLEGKTIWGLFNAVTRYTNHTAAPIKDESKQNYLMNGSGYKLSNLAYNELISYVESQTAQKVFVTI